MIENPKTSSKDDILKLLFSDQKDKEVKCENDNDYLSNDSIFDVYGNYRFYTENDKYENTVMSLKMVLDTIQ